MSHEDKIFTPPTAKSKPKPKTFKNSTRNNVYTSKGCLAPGKSVELTFEEAEKLGLA